MDLHGGAQCREEDGMKATLEFMKTTIIGGLIVILPLAAAVLKDRQWPRQWPHRK